VTDANILLVDDDAQFIEIMKKRLTMRSMEVFHAGSGEEALQKLALHGEIEVVILDVKLPGRSGIEMLQLISEQGKSLPVKIGPGEERLASMKCEGDGIAPEVLEPGNGILNCLYAHYGRAHL